MTDSPTITTMAIKLTNQNPFLNGLLECEKDYPNVADNQGEVPQCTIKEERNGEV